MCGSHGAPVQILADGLGDQGRAVAVTSGGVEIRAQLVIKGDGDADGHSRDATNDVVASTTCGRIGVSPADLGEMSTELRTSAERAE